MRKKEAETAEPLGQKNKIAQISGSKILDQSRTSSKIETKSRSNLKNNVQNLNIAAQKKAAPEASEKVFQEISEKY